MTLLNGKNINRGYSKRRNITNCRTLLSALYAFLLLLISFSCQKSPINGDLDGQWQVMDVSPEPMEKPIEQRIYYCFSLHVCQLTYYDGVFTAGNMAFDGKLSTLTSLMPHHMSVGRNCVSMESTRTPSHSLWNISTKKASYSSMATLLSPCASSEAICSRIYDLRLRSL